MQSQTYEKLRSLLASAKMELQKGTDDYATLQNQLGILQRSLDMNDVSDDELRAAVRAFPAKLRPMRAGAPPNEGLKETRKLWEELNHIIRSQHQVKS